MTEKPTKPHELHEPHELLAPHLLAAGRYVARALGLAEGDLPTDSASLAYVDAYIEQAGARGQGQQGGPPLQPEILALVAPALGAHFGEVVRARLGGRWVVEGTAPELWRLVIVDPQDPLRPLLSFSPVAMAAAALTRAEVTELGYDSELAIGGATAAQADRALAARVAEQLARVAPVDEAVFYSLTGRLEAMETIVDLLVELRRTAGTPRD